MPDIQVLTGDITTVEVDAVVNAANSSLMGGGGVDGAIHRTGGPEILEACKQVRAEQGELPTGQAVATTAGNLPAKVVIHTVGPVWHGGDSDEPALLRSCYRRSLQVAVEQDARSVAFPAISTGVYGYPLRKATEIAVDEVAAFQREHPDRAPDVTFVCFSSDDAEVYRSVLAAR